MCFSNVSETNSKAQTPTQTSSTVYTPQNPSYAALLRSQNLRHEWAFPIKPQLIVAPYHEAEVVAAMRCSKKLGLQIRVKSGGHDYEGLSHVSPRNPFVVVDMKNFRQVKVDAAERTAWVEVGDTLGEFYHTIAQHGKTLAFPAGVCPTVGVGGHFSGGGYGMISRRHGIAADNIVDARLIDANGEILDGDSMGEDLFWAIKGGGGTSFGVFLAFKEKLVAVPEIVTVFNVSRTSEEKSMELVHKWQHIADKIDERLTIRAKFTARKSPFTHNQTTIVASFPSLFLGRAEDLLPIMEEEFPELGLTEKDLTEMSWIQSVLLFSEIQNRTLDDALLSREITSQLYFKGKSDFIKNPISLQGLSEIWSFLEEDNRAFLQLSPYGGALSAFSESETPFPHRGGNVYMIHYGLAWAKEEEGERKMRWMRRFYGYMGRYASENPRSAYFNYRDLDIGMNNIGYYRSYEQASVWGFKYFGKKNFDRLVSVKTQVDPTNFFRNEQSIPPMNNFSGVEEL